MAKVFLSHSSKDKELINYLASELGHSNVIVDALSFESGQKSVEEIYRTMYSSDIFVLFISNDALDSKWVEKEIFFADGLIRNEKLSSFLPIVIDDTKHDDTRIPLWIRKEFSLRPIKNERIILNKIKNSIRETNFKLNPINEEIENTFFGHSELIDKEINRFYNTENWKPTCIIAYNHIEGIGRRTVIKNLLKRARIYKDKYHPIEIPFSKESIESFILKLNASILEDRIIDIDLSEISIGQKINIAIELIDYYANNQEIIFIIDDGSIILPNSQIVDWFLEIICHYKFKDKLVLCLISKYKPNSLILKRLNKTLDFKVEELNKRDTQSLFIRYLEILKIPDFNPEDKKFILEKLNGVPSQIIFTANYINESGLFEVKQNIEEVIKFSDHSSSSLLNIVKKDELAFQILLLISENPEIFSWSLIQNVFSDKNEIEVNNSLQRLHDLSIFNFMYGGYEYIKIGTTLADYINRSKLQANGKYRQKLNSIIKKEISKNDLDSLYKNDYSEFIMTLQSMIEDNQPINKKYFIPSFLLKSIIREYDRGNNEMVIKLCNQLLENSNNKYDEHIMWELYYKLCQSLAKCNSQDFFDKVKYFKNNQLEFNFLMGFYFRNFGNISKALQYYNEVLKINKEHKRTKHELVNIYLRKGDYSSAIQNAEDNYIDNKNNVYNIHSLFVCIVRTGLGKKRISLVKELIANIKKSHSEKGRDMYRCMIGEYEYYINDNLDSAIRLLEDAKNLNANKSYPLKALEIIYRKRDMRNALSNIEIINYNIDDIDYLDV